MYLSVGQVWNAESQSCVFDERLNNEDEYLEKAAAVF